jgi:hypothetical protein
MIHLLLPLCTPALAGSEVLLELPGVHTPLFGVEVGTEASTGDPVPDLLLTGDFRGLGGTDVGVHWAALGIAARLDPALPTSDRLRGSLSVARWVGETTPVPIVWDVHFGRVDLAREDRLGLDWDGVLTVASAVAGFYFPAVDAGDFDGHIVAELDVGGAHRREYLAPGLEPYTGARLGAAGGEIVTGVALGRGVVLATHLHGQAAWSLGVSRIPAVLTDTTVDLGLTLRLGRHLAILLDGGAESTRDPGNDFAASYFRAAGRVRVAE